MSPISREFDIIIFGATGYTGRYVIEELANTSKSNNFKWAVAGRDSQKLRDSLDLVQKYLQDIDILQTPIIKADVYDQKSILEMCQQAKVILNCVGPYKLFGEIVVSSCIEAGTHHVDLSGEFHFLETTQAKYFNAAREKGVYVVQACGFDSIPGDYGVSLVKKNFPGDLNSVEYFVEVKQGPSGRQTNIGTFLSILESSRDLFRISQYDQELKKSVFKKDMIKSKYSLPFRLPVHFSEVVKSWCFWFIGPDERVIKRSQMFRNEFLNDRPVQVKGYVKMPSLLNILLLFFFAGIVGFLSLFSFGRYILAKYPSFFTFGQFSKEGPTRQQVTEGSTTFTLVGEGWKYKLSEPTDQHESKPDTKLKLVITGPEPAYPLTSMCMVQAGMVILQEKEKLPLEGGVLTPGVAFENTSLMKRLEERGMNFTFDKKF